MPVPPRRPNWVAHALVLPLAWLSLPPPALAQDQEVVVTATRVPTPIERLPAAVTVIDRATIEERGYQTLAEALSGVPGLTLAPTGGAGSATTAFLRGANSNHTLVLLNGVPVNDPSTPSNLFDFGKDTLGDVERIEVVRGAMSSLYGSGAIGGVINIITRKGREEGVNFDTEVTGGVPRQGAARATASGKHGAFDFAVTGETRSERGSNAIASRLSTSDGERDGYRSRTGSVRLGLDAAEWLRLEGFARWSRSVYGLDSEAFDLNTFQSRLGDDPNYTGRDRTETYGASAIVKPLGDLLTATLTMARTRTVRELDNEPDARNPSGFDFSTEGRRDVLGLDTQWRLGSPVGGVVDDLVLGLGVQSTTDEIDNVSFSRGAAEQDLTGLYASAQALLGGFLDATVSLRRDEAEGFDGATTFRVGGSVPVMGRALRLKAAYGTSYLAPSLSDRFGDFPPFFFGNPDLEPERGKTAEVGLESRLPLGSQREGLVLGATLFSSRITDLITTGLRQDGASTRVNVGRAAIEGLELTALVRPVPRVELGLGYTWTVAEDQDLDRLLPRRPRHQAKLSARLGPYERFTLAPEVLLVGPYRDAFIYADDGTRSGYGDSPGGVVVGLTGTYAVDERFDLVVRGSNLLGSEYEPVNGFQIPGRSVWGGVRARF